MKKAKIVKWLDKVTKLRKEMNKHGEYKKIILANSYDWIVVFEGIGYLANAVGEELKTKIHCRDNLPYEAYFEYNGFKITQLGTKEMIVKELKIATGEEVA